MIDFPCLFFGLLQLLSLFCNCSELPAPVVLLVSRYLPGKTGIRLWDVHCPRSSAGEDKFPLGDPLDREGFAEINPGLNWNLRIWET